MGVCVRAKDSVCRDNQLKLLRPKASRSRQLLQERHEDLTFHRQVPCPVDSHETPYLPKSFLENRVGAAPLYIISDGNACYGTRGRDDEIGSGLDVEWRGRKLLGTAARAELSIILETATDRDVPHHSDQMTMRCLVCSLSKWLVARRLFCKGSRYECP